MSAAVTSAYVQQYAGTGLGRGTVQTFAEIGLQRGVYDAYRQEGFSREDIGDAAKATKALDWKHDRQAFDDIQRSTKPERAAFVEIDREKDAEKRKALIARRRQENHIDEKSEKERGYWDRTIDHIQAKGQGAVLKQGRGAAADEASTALTTERSGEHFKATVARVRVAKLETSEARSNAAQAKVQSNDFGVSAKPTSSTYFAEIKPANPSPKVR